MEGFEKLCSVQTPTLACMSAIQEEKLRDMQVLSKNGAVNTVVRCDTAYRVGRKSLFYFVDVRSR